MIPLRIQMCLYIELAELQGWVEREVPLFSCYQRFANFNVKLISFPHTPPTKKKKKRNGKVKEEKTSPGACMVLNMLFLVKFKQEEAYVDFLRIRRVPLEERKSSDDVPDVIPQVSWHLCPFALLALSYLFSL